MTRVHAFLATVLLLLPPPALAWWNDEWSGRKAITVDTSAKGLGLAAEATDVPVLVRLHAGNFSDFFLIKEGAADLRFVAGDDKTPLKHHVEKFDPVNEIALIWVKLPRLAAGASETVWMYYGNAEAASADDAAGTYDVSQGLVLHFDGDGAARDKSAHTHQPARATARPQAASLIGGGARFDGKESIAFPASPSLALSAAKGWTFSAWVRLDGEQADAYLLHSEDGARRLVLGIDGRAVYARLTEGGRKTETAKTPALDAGGWHHVALVVTADRLAVFIDGAETASAAAAVVDMSGAITLGAAADGAHGFRGELDEVQVATAARPAPWLKAAARTQGASATGITYGDSAAREGGGTSYFGTILRNVTIDGWIVIFLLAIMAAVSWVVMVGKGLVIARVRKDNRDFLRRFQDVTSKNAAALDQANNGEAELQDSEFLTALFGKHDHFQSSPLYRLYHVGIKELRLRVGESVGARRAKGLSQRALTGVQVALDAALTRETQKLNGQMVLLTIAISGGPFLGLLGTVVGVMITFAAIAASGDVNVNAIAPGIAAALVATVAGLAVAIPALFAYNYLTIQIRDLAADMRVFVDEFMSRIAEHYGE